MLVVEKIHKMKMLGLFSFVVAFVFLGDVCGCVGDFLGMRRGCVGYVFGMRWECFGDVVLEYPGDVLEIY